MCRTSIVCVVLSIFSSGYVAQQVAAEEAPPTKPMVYVDVCVAEISLSKLRTLGFDWSHIATFKSNSLHDTVPDPIKFFDALQQYNLAQIRFRPRLATMSGRPASLHIADTLRLDVVATSQPSEKIQLEYRIDLKLPAPTTPDERRDQKHSVHQLLLDAATELVPGETCCVSETRTRRTTENGKTSETATLVLIRADLKPPSDIRTVEGLPMSDVEARYRDVEVRRPR
ncbi:MAG TPA: hypothetical protein VFV87_10735 [Pirellulaceae bacterium]|nr:hypothetical protein [Pirellulaceae bacterium]